MCFSSRQLAASPEWSHQLILDPSILVGGKQVFCQTTVVLSCCHDLHPLEIYNVQKHLTFSVFKKDRTSSISFRSRWILEIRRFLRTAPPPKKNTLSHPYGWILFLLSSDLTPGQALIASFPQLLVIEPRDLVPEMGESLPGNLAKKSQPGKELF